MTDAEKSIKRFRLVNHLPCPIFIEAWKTRDKNKKLILHLKAYCYRPTASKYSVWKINNGQFMDIKIAESLKFEFTSCLGRNVSGKHHQTEYGYLVSFDYFTEGAN